MFQTTPSVPQLLQTGSSVSDLSANLRCRDSQSLSSGPPFTTLGEPLEGLKGGAGTDARKFPPKNEVVLSQAESKRLAPVGSCGPWQMHPPSPSHSPFRMYLTVEGNTLKATCEEEQSS